MVHDTKGGDVVRVERSGELAPKRTMQVAGLEEVPMNIIPLPFYKLVQPGSSNIQLTDGKDAPTGNIYMKDSGKSVGTIRMALLRAKHQRKQFTGDDGEMVSSVSMGVLGVNLDGFTPFILNVSVASFGNFGQLMKQIQEREVTRAWEYPIKITTVKREETKMIKGRPQKVKYWVLAFELETTKLEENALGMLDSAYEEFAASLDRQSEFEEQKNQSQSHDDPGPTPF